MFWKCTCPFSFNQPPVTPTELNSPVSCVVIEIEVISLPTYEGRTRVTIKLLRRIWDVKFKSRTVSCSTMKSCNIQSLHRNITKTATMFFLSYWKACVWQQHFDRSIPNKNLLHHYCNLITKIFQISNLLKLYRSETLSWYFTFTGSSLFRNQKKYL